MRKQGIAGNEPEVVIFGTPGSGGFQVYPAEPAGGSKPWRSQRALERFYSTSPGIDAGDKSGILQALKGSNRFEMFFVRYGVLSREGGREGGCVGFAVFSQKGFPRDLPELRTDAFEAAIEQFVDEAQVLTTDKEGRLCFCVDTFETIAPHLDHALEGLAQYVAPKIEGADWQRAPAGILGDFPIVGGGTSASVTKAIILRYGGIQISPRAKDCLSLNEIISSREKSAPQSQNLALVGPTVGAVISLNDVISSLVTVTVKISDAQQSLGDLQTSATTALARARAMEAQQKVAPNPPFAAPLPEKKPGTVWRAAPVRTSGEDRTSSNPLFIVLALVLLAAASTAMYCYRLTEQRVSAPAAQEEPSSSLETTEAPARTKFLDVERFLSTMVARQMRVTSPDEFIEHVANFLWENRTIQSDFNSKDSLMSFLKKNNRQHLAAIKEHIRSNISGYEQERNGVFYNTERYWREAIGGGGGEGFRIRE